MEDSGEPPEVVVIGEALAEIAPYASVVTPSCPADSQALLGIADPRLAAAACLDLGAKAAAVTCGADGVHLATAGGERQHVPASPAPVVVDATGAGDAFAGTLAARLARGADLPAAVRGGTAAAARCLAGQGGTGWAAAPDEVEGLLGSA